MKLKKIDRRMNGYGDFLYVLDLHGRIIRPEFDRVRRWCWETWGPSSELDIWQAVNQPDDRNTEWCWDYEHQGSYRRCRIYLASEQAATLFSLKWA